MCKIYPAINFALFYVLFSNQWNFEYSICLLLNICFGEIDANKNCTIRNRWTCEYVKKKDELTWGGFVDLGHMWILFKMQLKKGPKSTDRIFHWIIPHKPILCHSMSVFDGVPALLATITDWSLVVVFHVMLNWIWIVS